MTDLIILSTLLAGPKHGYQLKREAGMILGQGVLHNNLVYPLLRRFMDQGWVTRREAAGERGQTRLRYAITAAGRRELVAKLSAFSDQDARSSDAFRLRVALFQLLDPQIRKSIFQRRITYLTARLHHLQVLEQNFPLNRYAGEVISQFSAETKSELKWIRRLRSAENSQKKEVANA
jgi:DNA-binding PadR family transcriptional regulator